jgi:hypothetical protein
MVRYYTQQLEPKPFPNSRSALLQWEEAIQYLHDLANNHILEIKAYWAKDMDNPRYRLSLDHIWDIKASKDQAWDFVMSHLGLAEYFEIEH